MEDQRKTLAAAGADLSREFCDELSATRAKMPGRVRAEWLEERARMLKPTSRQRGETILVASLLVFGVDPADLIVSLGNALGRRDTVAAVDSGFSLGPGAGAAELGAAVLDWTRAKRDAQTKPGRRDGNRAAAEKARARTLAKLPAARGPWRQPDKYTAQQVATLCGLSIKTLYTELGRRPMKRRKPHAKR